jgi:hypothetical protein
MRSVPVLPDCQRNPPQMHSQRTCVKSSVHQKVSHRMRGHGLSVNGRNQHPLASSAAHPFLSSCAESAGKNTSTLGLFLRIHAINSPLRRITSA